MKAELQELAARDYGGDFQGLLRETLQARLDANLSRTGPIDEVRRVVEDLGESITRQHEDLRGPVDQLLALTRDLMEPGSSRTDPADGTRQALAELGESITRQYENLLGAVNDLPGRTRALTGIAADQRAGIRIIPGDLPDPQKLAARQTDAIAGLCEVVRYHTDKTL